MKAGKLLAHAVTAQDHGGTLSFSALDKQGNFIALTLTHGNGFGAQLDRFDEHDARRQKRAVLDGLVVLDDLLQEPARFPNVRIAAVVVVTPIP